MEALWKQKRGWFSAAVITLAVLTSGTCTAVDVVINRHLDPGKMSRLAIFRINNVYRRTGDKIADLLTVEFLRHGYNLIERAKLEQIIRELKLGRSGLIDQERAVEVGRLAGADTVILGNGEINSREPNRLKHLVIKCIDVQSGGVLLAVQLKVEMNVQDAIPEMIAEMQKKIVAYKKNGKGAAK